MDPSPPIQDWLVAFLWTCALELPVYVALLGRHFRRWWSPVVLALAVNVLTHPALWYLYPRYAPYWWWLVSAESTVICVEATVIALVLRPRLGLGRAAAWGGLGSLAANTFSTVVGLLVQRVLA